jgi:peptidoglycan hydrolase-like protein with peptidoglycan-binding domain
MALKLKKGDKNGAVMTLQGMLASRGYLKLKSGPSGTFDDETEAAVKKVHKDFGVPPIGVATDDTIFALTIKPADISFDTPDLRQQAKPYNDKEAEILAEAKKQKKAFDDALEKLLNSLHMNMDYDYEKVWNEAQKMDGMTFWADLIESERRKHAKSKSIIEKHKLVKSAKEAEKNAMSAKKEAETHKKAAETALANVTSLAKRVKSVKI